MANDYVDILMNKCDSFGHQDYEQLRLIKKHFYAFSALCSLDFKFSFLPSSMLAAASLLTAVDGLQKSQAIVSQDILGQLVYELSNLIECDVDNLIQVKELIDNLYFNNTMGNQINDAEEEEVVSGSHKIETLTNQNSNFEFVDDYDFDLDYNLESLNFEVNSNDYINVKSINNNNKQIKSDNSSSHEESDNSNNISSCFGLYSPSFIFDQDQEYICNKLDSNLIIKSLEKKSAIKRKSKSKKGKKLIMPQPATLSSSSSNMLSRSSSASSGISSIASVNYHNQSGCPLLTPPTANLVPLPSF
jgi:hypothetical protein